MLLNDFYNITATEIIDSHTFRVSIALSTNHAIFAGHFPGLPIVPGVCMMAIVKELLSEHLKRKVVLHKASNLKFLSLINPLQNKEVDVQIKYTIGDDSLVTTDAFISSGDLIFFKLAKAIYK